MNSKENRFYLQALGVTALFICLLFVLWINSGGPASEAEIRNANGTRTAIAATQALLLGISRTDTPPPAMPPTSAAPTRLPRSTSSNPQVPTITPTSLLPQLNTPAPGVASLTPLSTGTTLVPGIPQTGIQDPAEFARWYFGRVWRERDYQNLWDNYLTASYKANVGSGLFEDYVGWWNSVEKVDVNAVDVLENNEADAWVRVNLTFHMKNGRVVQNEIYDYNLLYDASQGTWMFDYNAVSP